MLPTLSRSFFNADAPGDDSIFGTDAGRHEDISRNGSSGCGGNAHTAEVAHLGRLLITRRSQQGYALTLRLFNFFFTPRLTLVQKNDTPRMIDEKTLKKSCWRRSSRPGGQPHRLSKNASKKFGDRRRRTSLLWGLPPQRSSQTLL